MVYSCTIISKFFFSLTKPKGAVLLKCDSHLHLYIYVYSYKTFFSLCCIIFFIFYSCMLELFERSLVVYLHTFKSYLFLTMACFFLLRSMIMKNPVLKGNREVFICCFPLIRISTEFSLTAGFSLTFLIQTKTLKKIFSFAGCHQLALS